MTPSCDEKPRVPLLGPDEVDGASRRIFEAFLRERGNIPNLFRATAHRPPIMETLFAHMRAVMGPGEVDVLLKEMLAVRVSHLNGCRY